MPRKSKAQMMKDCTNWNAAHPVGADVVVKRDMGDEVRTKTRSEAYMCDAGYPVIFLDNITGYYLLDRVRSAPSEREEP